MKTVLITGGAGFIGSHLCGHFLEMGHKVICIDSFFSGKKENIMSFIKNDNFTLIKHNIIYPLKQKFDRLDEIYNLACPASPMQYQFDPVLTLKTSVDGTLNMLDLARKYGAKMLHTSTSEVYGDPLEHPQKESYFGNVDPLGKRACYDEGKRSAETLCKDYNLQYKVDVRIVRLFNIYGPHMMFNDGRVMSNFILQGLLGDDITVHGDGSQSRSFMYITDLLNAFNKLMAADSSKVNIGPINLGNPDERTILSLAEDINKLTGQKSRIEMIPYDNIPERLGDPKQRKPDISRAKELLNWEPKVDYNYGIKKTIDDFRARLDEKTRIVVFSPAFMPIKGPAENVAKELIERMVSYDFDIITAKLSPKFKSYEKVGRMNIYRIGSGRNLDKYLLAFFGPFKAWQLHKKNNYQAAWSIMASYGAIATIIFSLLTRVAFLVSLFEGKIDNTASIKKRLFSPIYRLIFRRAHKLQVVADLTQEQQAWLEDERVIRPVDMDKGLDYAMKKTREDFQQLEILTSRL